MKQNKRKNNKTFLISGLLFGIALILVFGFFLATPFKASAAIVRTPVYTTYGSYSYDGKTYSGYPSSSFKVTLNGALTEGTGTIYNNNVINWTWYTFKVVDTEVYEHVSVKLYKNNSLFYSQNLSDDGNITLFDKSLSDGEYRFEYSCKVGNFFVNTLYTYTYCFRVDSTAPTVSLKAGGSTISDGTYTNKQVVYSATDASTVRIYVKSPTASDFGVSYNSSYTVAASAGNNGWWYVYASDSVDNSTSCKSFYMDVTSPYGTVYGGTSSVSSGGYTNASYVKYVASDTNSGVANCYVRKPGSSSYVAYTSGSQLTTEGTYYFYCVDKAGNTSSTSTITLDKSIPWGTLYGGATSKSSGSYTNADYIKYTASDSWSGVNAVYVKMPNTSLYTTYSSGTQLATEGTYSFYCVDKAGNQSSIVTITLDKTKPTGRITGDGNNISQYTKASYIKFIASDSNSGVANCYVKKPNSSSYVAYTSGTELTAEGSYTFYCTDNAGNASAYYSVIVDRQVPVGTVHGGEAIKSNGVYTNASYVKYTANDGVSGIKALYVKMPNSSTYSSYSSGTQLATEGTYYFYAVDNAGNQSATMSITLDKTKPTGIIYGGTKELKSGAYTNASYVKFVPSDNILLNSIYVKKPNATSYSSYTSGTELTAEGTYTFYCTDKAGNTSEYYTVTVDRQAPKGQLYVDGKVVSSGAYTNGKYIKFVCSDNCFVKMPDSTTYTKYVSGTEFEKVGKYVFYSTDAAGNTSSNYTIIIDRTQKKATLTNITDNVTNGDVKISWSNGDSNVYAPIKSVTVNGMSVTNGQIIYTIKTGAYTVSVLDTAGNVWTTSFNSEKQNILTAMLQKEYFETSDKDGNIFAFASYEKALEFAISRENGFVKIETWNSSSWNTGIAMDEKDSVNAKNGQYFIYKKSGNPSEQVAYFTEARLNEVISEYAIASIKNYYYWQKAPEVIADGETLYSYADENGIVENKIEICENVSVLLDGVEVDTTVIETEGKHVITILDEYGNSCEYPVTIIRTAPTVNYVVGEEVTELSFDRIYYFKNEVTISISDELDEFAMFRVYRIDLGDDRQLIGIKSLGESFTLSESGTYAIVAINHAGESEYYNVLISLNAPEIVFDANAENKQLIITVKPSIDFESNIQSLVIYKSNDGENWEIVSADDYGTTVELETLVYKFNTSAMYRVALSDEFHTGIDVISKEIKYTQPTLAIELEGVENGGYTSGVVKFSWKDEAKVTATKNGVAFDYRAGVRLSEDGDYVIIFENNDGYKVVYKFTIDTKKPTITVNGAKNDETVNNDVSISFNESGLKGILFKDGESISEYTSETVISEDGYYTLIVTDKANNQSEVSFAIDKTVSYIANINDGALANSVIIVENEKLEFVVTRNGEVIEFDDGDEITEPADYVVKMTDKLGNSTELSFTIVEPTVTEFKHNFDDLAGFEKVLVNGEETRLNYGTLELFEDGEYEIVVVANGDNNTFYVNIDATAPTLTMKGVTNNGKTNGVVVLSDVTEDAEVKVFFNDEEIEYTVGEELSEIGKYKVVVTDECGNTTEYDFSIEKGANIGLFVLIGIVVLAAAGVIVFFVIKKKNSI